MIAGGAGTDVGGGGSSPFTSGPDDVWISYPMIAPFTVPGVSVIFWFAFGARKIPFNVDWEFDTLTLFVAGGTTGGGGSNFTGSYSGTASVTPSVPPVSPPTSDSSLSGFTNSNLGPISVNVTLSVLNSGGNWSTVATTMSDAVTGAYSFGSLPAGTYLVSFDAPTPPPGYFVAGFSTSDGFLNGSADNGVTNPRSIESIVVGSDMAGTQFNFNVIFLPLD
jgi:hypothetical protein